ncbi:MAG: histidine phosphatase family protein [Anaerolineales bacterium]
MTRLILIRHGETDWNREGRYTGQTDIPLNDVGLRQARNLAERLREELLDALYSSDLARATMTSRLVSEVTGTKVRLDTRLREINQGEWEGLPFNEIRNRYRRILDLRKKEPLSAAPPGGETIGEVQSRVLDSLEDILGNYPHRTVAIVSHGLPLAIIKTHFNDLPIEAIWDHIPENAVPFVIDAES